MSGDLGRLRGKSGFFSWVRHKLHKRDPYNWSSVPGETDKGFGTFYYRCNECGHLS